MRIECIKIKNFIGCESVRLDLESAKIHCFVGPNGSGKSTIRDAIQWCLLGTLPNHREVKTKEQMAKIVRNGQKKAEVEVVLDGKSYKRSRTLKTADGSKFTTDPNLELALDSYAFLDASPTVQKIVLKRILGLERPDKKLLQDRFGKTNTHKGLINLCVNHGFEKAEAEAVLLRRGAKRELQGIALTEPNGTYEGRGMTYDLAGIERESVEKQLKKLKTERDFLLVKKGETQAVQNVDVNYLLNTSDRLERELKRLNETGYDIKTIKKQISELEKDLNKFTQERAKLTASSVLDRVEQCPIYGIDCPAKDQINEMIDQQEKERKAVLKKLQENEDLIDDRNYRLKLKQGVLRDAEDHERQKKNMAEELERVKEKIKEAKTKPPQNQIEIEQIEKQITEISDRIRNGENILHALDKFEKEVERYQKNLKKAEEIRKQIAFYDEAAKFFGPNGIIKELITEGLTKINDRIKTVGLLNVVINEELQPVLNGCPLPSKSERFRMGVVIQEAISYLTETRLLIVDEADQLDPANRSFLLQSLYKIKDDYDTILVFSTIGDKEVLPSPVAEIQMWMVEGGRVNKR